MYHQITSIQRNEHLPDQLLLAIKKANTLIVIGVNWDSWYVQSLIRWIVSDYKKYQQIYTCRNRVTAENAAFLKNMPVIAFDLNETDFVDLLYQKAGSPGRPKIS